MSDFWSTLPEPLEHELSSQQFNTWIKALCIEEDGEIPRRNSLVAPTASFCNGSAERYLTRIEALRPEFFGEPIDMSMALAGTGRGTKHLPRLPGPDCGSRSAGRGPARCRKWRQRIRQEPPNPAFTFDTMVTGRANDLARAASSTGRHQSRRFAYNPLFVYGGVGLGKTHLIHAIGNALLAEIPKPTSATFTPGIMFPDVVGPTSNAPLMPSSAPTVPSIYC